MRILINHLTRMKPGYICVAGIDPETGARIRPVLNCRLGNELLRKNGGVFEIGAFVDLGPVKDVGEVPESEDHEFSVENLKYVRRAKPEEFWKFLNQTSEDTLEGIFGDDLEPRGKGCTVDVECGIASLGGLETDKITSVEINPWGKIRVRLSDEELNVDLSVTDIRLYKKDQETPRPRIVESVAERMSETKVILSVGLARPWTKPGDTAPRHWLQANNFHLQDDPLGESFEF